MNRKQAEAAIQALQAEISQFQLKAKINKEAGIVFSSSLETEGAAPGDDWYIAVVILEQWPAVPAFTGPYAATFNLALSSALFEGLFETPLPFTWGNVSGVIEWILDKAQAELDGVIFEAGLAIPSEKLLTHLTQTVPSPEKLPDWYFSDDCIPLFQASCASAPQEHIEIFPAERKLKWILPEEIVSRIVVQAQEVSR